MQKKDVIPKWFTDAINSPCEDCFFTVKGTQIHYRARGRKDLPGLVLLHGGGAHLHWWACLQTINRLGLMSCGRLFVDAEDYLAVGVP